MTGSQLLAFGARALAAAGVPDGARDARRLMAHALNVPPGRLTLILPEEVSAEQAAVFENLITRRAGRVPVSHLTGRRMFFGRDFLVTPDVLDPRPETETLIEAALSGPFRRVLDLGTGSGCILLTLVAEREGATGIGTDLSAAALDVALRNRDALMLAERVAFREGDWFEPLGAHEERFDLIVSNPPYVTRDEMADLAPEVRDHEPRLALTDERDGLSAYRAIVAQAPASLIPGGRLLVEIGVTQGAAVSAMMAAAGLTQIAILHDIDGRDRVVRGELPQV